MGEAVSLTEECLCTLFAPVALAERCLSVLGGSPYATGGCP
jgi:hypothetical protein